MSAKISSWHPMGDIALNPTKAQLLYACGVATLTASEIEKVVSPLFLSEGAFRSALNEMTDKGLLWRCINKGREVFVLTTKARGAVSRVVLQNPMFVEMAERLLAGTTTQQ